MTIRTDIEELKRQNSYLAEYPIVKRLIAQVERMERALKELLRQTNNIEVLGEWSALDINPGLSKKARAEVDACKTAAREALAAMDKEE